MFVYLALGRLFCCLNKYIYIILISGLGGQGRDGLFLFLVLHVLL